MLVLSKDCDGEGTKDRVDSRDGDGGPRVGVHMLLFSGGDQIVLGELGLGFWR